MIIGIPKEIKESEYRVGMTPSGIQTLIQNGHVVYMFKTLLVMEVDTPTKIIQI